MSRRSRRNRTLNANRNVLSTSISKSFTLEDLDRLSSEIEIRKAIEIQKAYSSNDPTAILAAASYLQKSKDKDKSQLKSYIFDPDVTSLNAGGFRVPTKGVSFDTLKRMARTPVIRTIIDTRKDQVASFAEPVDNEQERGWMIRRKRTRFSDIDDDEISDSDKKIIERITKFILDGGSVDNKWDFDGFEEYIRQLANDSLVIDQVCFENVYSRGGELVQYYPVDGATIRLVDTSDTFNLVQYAKPKNGYWPKYCQVWMNDICALYYPWELGYGIRNKTTDIYANGYGQSELEDLVGVVTWILYGMQYNGNFFSQGSNPKGFFSIEGAVSPNALEDFKQMWRNTVMGVWNAHKIPVIETGGSKVNWVNMMGGNMKDMEFHKWLEFLITVACCVFRIDPSECGFNLEGMKGIFGQDGQKERLKHSQSKGLTPILKLFQRLFTKYLVEPLDDQFEFIFCGVETEDQQMALDMDVKKVQNGFMSMEDGFKKWSGRDFDPENDTILNSIYFQMQQAKQMGGDAMGMMGGEMDMGQQSDNPFDQYEDQSNPFEKALVNYLSKGIKDEE